MRETCKHCAKPLEPAATGRPAIFCSTGCRRAAEVEVRRLDRALEKLERDAAHARLYGRGSVVALLDEPEAVLANLAAEISRQRERMASLLDD